MTCNEGQFEALYALLSAKAEETPFPLSCTFELTYKCNLRCRHCYLAPMERYFRMRDLSAKEVFSLFEGLRETGCLQLILTGGEIFMRQDIFDIIGKAKALGFCLVLFSNATMITEETARRLSQYAPLSMEISLYGMKKENYEGASRVEGSFARFFEGIRLLREKGIGIKLKMPVLSLNQSDFEEARYFAHRIGAPFQYDPFITPRWDGSDEPLRLRLPPKEAMRIRLDHLRFTKEDGRKVKFWTDTCDHTKRVFGCACGKSHTVIDPQGKMRLCMDLLEPKADALALGVRRAWEAMVAFVRTKRPGPEFECPTCFYQRFCSRSPARAYIETGSVEKCIPFHKEVAKETMRNLERQPARTP